MDDDERERWREAGRITAEARRLGREQVEVGGDWADVCEAVEGFIRDEGAEPAFPTNISVNEDAAHDTARPREERTFEEGDVVKIDVGAHVDGYIGDTATTILLGDRGADLREAAEAALEAGIGTVQDGANVSEIGAAVQDAMHEKGAKPIANLTGHLIERYEQHAGLSIPNIPHGDAELEAGMVVAVEPFATEGAGRIHEAEDGGIYHFKRSKPQRQKHARLAMETIEEEYDELPFASRWLVDAGVDERRMPMVVRALKRQDCIEAYGVLTEDDDGLVAQAEHTMIVTEDGAEVTTLAE